MYQIDSIVKTAKDTTITPFGTTKLKGVIRGPNHYKCVNVVIDDLPENQCCRDVAVMQQIQILKPGSNKIPVVLQNLSCRVLKIRKGTKIAHVKASNVDPSLMASWLSENIPETVVEKSPKSKLLENLPKGNDKPQKTF